MRKFIWFWVLVFFIFIIFSGSVASSPNVKLIYPEDGASNLDPNSIEFIVNVTGAEGDRIKFHYWTLDGTIDAITPYKEIPRNGKVSYTPYSRKEDKAYFWSVIIDDFEWDNENNPWKFDTGGEFYYHYECNNQGRCEKVYGRGSNECDENSDCYHKECVQGVCKKILSPGTNECNETGDCSKDAIELISPLDNSVVFAKYSVDLKYHVNIPEGCADDTFIAIKVFTEDRWGKGVIDARVGDSSPQISAGNSINLTSRYHNQFEYGDTVRWWVVLSCLDSRARQIRIPSEKRKFTIRNPSARISNCTKEKFVSEIDYRVNCSAMRVGSKEETWYSNTNSDTRYYDWIITEDLEEKPFKIRIKNCFDQVKEEDISFYKVDRPIRELPPDICESALNKLENYKVERDLENPLVKPVNYRKKTGDTIEFRCEAEDPEGKIDRVLIWIGECVGSDCTKANAYSWDKKAVDITDNYNSNTGYYRYRWINPYSKGTKVGATCFVNDTEGNTCEKNGNWCGDNFPLFTVGGREATTSISQQQCEVKPIYPKNGASGVGEDKWYLKLFAKPNVSSNKMTVFFWIKGTSMSWAFNREDISTSGETFKFPLKLYEGSSGYRKNRTWNWQVNIYDTRNGGFERIYSSKTFSFDTYPSCLEHGESSQSSDSICCDHLVLKEDLWSNNQTSLYVCCDLNECANDGICESDGTTYPSWNKKCQNGEWIPIEETTTVSPQPTTIQPTTSTQPTTSIQPQCNQLTFPNLVEGKQLVYECLPYQGETLSGGELYTYQGQTYYLSEYDRWGEEDQTYSCPSGQHCFYKKVDPDSVEKEFYCENQTYPEPYRGGEVAGYKCLDIGNNQLEEHEAHPDYNNYYLSNHDQWGESTIKYSCPGDKHCFYKLVEP